MDCYVTLKIFSKLNEPLLAVRFSYKIYFALFVLYSPLHLIFNILA